MKIYQDLVMHKEKLLCLHVINFLEKIVILVSLLKYRKWISCDIFRGEV